MKYGSLSTREKGRWGTLGECWGRPQIPHGLKLRRSTNGASSFLQVGNLNHFAPEMLAVIQLLEPAPRRLRQTLTGNASEPEAALL